MSQSQYFRAYIQSNVMTRPYSLSLFILILMIFRIICKARMKYIVAILIALEHFLNPFLHEYYISPIF